jgi:DNA-binding MarR family transcriptional regulator
MFNHITNQIAEYSRVLAQVLDDVVEYNFLMELPLSNLTRTQFTMLKILAVSAPRTVSTMAEILRISRAAASKNIDKLVRIRLVSRRAIKSDRRISEVVLTDRARELVERYENIRMQKQQEALSGFNEQERQQFSDLLRRYVSNCLSQEKSIDLICLQCNGSISDACLLRDYHEGCRFYFKSTNAKSNHRED